VSSALAGVADGAAAIVLALALTEAQAVGFGHSLQTFPTAPCNAAAAADATRKPEGS